MANMRDLAIATVNLLNLQVPGGHTYDRSKPAIPDDPAGHLAYETRLSWLARTVERLDADVICFQELWSRQALEDVFARVSGTGTYDLVARDAPAIGKPQVALAVRRGRNGQSRLLPGTDWIPAFPETFRLKGIRENVGGGGSGDIPSPSASSPDRCSSPASGRTGRRRGRPPSASSAAT